MYFIGILADNEDFEFIKKELLKDEKYSNLQLLNLDKDNIENLRNIKFETLVISMDIKKLKNKKYIINNILKESKYLLINSDINTLIGPLKNNQIKTITYGMNQKATVTTSSVKEDEILICLQRNIENIKGEMIEIQEFKVKTENTTTENIYKLIALFIIKLLYKI